MELKTEIKRFLDTLDRSPRTVFTYSNALEQFVNAVGEDVELNTETYTAFLAILKSKSPSTQTRLHHCCAKVLYVLQGWQLV